MTAKSKFLDASLAWPTVTPRLRTTVILNLVLAAAYFVVGVGALKLAFVGERVVVFWPPAGMAFAALWLLGPRAIPGVYLGSLAVDVVILQVWPPSLVGAFGNLLAPMITTFVLRRLLRERAGLREFSRVLAFIVVGVVFGATISASIGCFALTVIGHERAPVAPMWGSWLMGDSIGVLMVAPAILMWRRITDVLAAWRTAVEPVLLVLAAAAVMVAFTFIREASWTVELYKLFTFVLILSAAARYGLIGAAIGSLLAAVGTVAVSLVAFGPYLRSTMFESFALFYSSLVLQASAGLLLAAALADLGTTAASEKQAREAAEAEAVNRIRLLTAISHDVRTPLAGIVGVLQTLQRSSLAPGELGLVGLALRAGTTLSKIIADILEAARLEAGGGVVEPAPFGLGASLADVVALSRGRAAAKGLTLDLTGLEHLPPLVMGDRVRCEQIFGNLVDNAIAYTQVGGVAVTVASRLGDGAPLVVEISDTGPGIDPKRMAVTPVGDALAPRPGHGEAGLGIGLRISNQLARLMGGAIIYRTADGGGSCFRIELPFPVVAAADPPPSTPRSDMPLRILLIEDDEISREVTCALLASHGHQVAPASSIETALALAASDAFDLVLTDNALASDSAGGLEVARALRNLPGPAARTSIIALTAEGRPDVHAAYREAGINGAIVKPLMLTDGLDTVLQRAAWS
jgi:signal transduction histidine kinase